MSKTANATVSKTSTVNLVELQAREKELKEKKRLLKQLQDRQAWEATTKARNPQYVMGSLRPATTADENLLTHCHGWVCEIACESCGQIRVVNKQDAFQARFCKECNTEARKAKGKAKRLGKKLEGMNAADLEARIAELDAKIAEMQ